MVLTSETTSHFCEMVQQKINLRAVFCSAVSLVAAFALLIIVYGIPTSNDRWGMWCIISLALAVIVYRQEVKRDAVQL